MSISGRMMPIYRGTLHSAAAHWRPFSCAENRKKNGSDDNNCQGKSLLAKVKRDREKEAVI